jgi:hypothetical protein
VNDKLGWALAGLAFVVGYIGWGWRGLVLALTVVIFWMLLQFSRTLRVLRMAAAAPVGHVANAVMLHSKLRRGMRLADVIRMTGSLGHKNGEESEVYRWRDASEAFVQIEFVGGRCSQWQLVCDPTDPSAQK